LGDARRKGKCPSKSFSTEGQFWGLISLRRAKNKNKNIFINEYLGGVKTEINEKHAFYGRHNSGI
jgi:hypothetical protein